MTTLSITKYRAQGAIILERLSGTTVPVGLKAYVIAFKKAHDDYEAAAVVADTAREKRDLALDALGETDDTFDTGINVLADKMVGAGLGTRKNPFAVYSKYAPSKLTELPYAEEPKAIRALGIELTRKNPPADVTKALAMFQRMSVPVLGIVENMTAFACPHCGELTEIFGRGGGERFAAQHGLEYLGGVPLDITVRQGGDVGVPAVAQREPGPAARALTAVAQTVAARMSVRTATADARPLLTIS